MDNDISTACCSSEIPSLKFISTRYVALLLFQTNVHWRKLDEVIQIIQRWLYKATLPTLIKKQLQSGLRDVYREIERWNEKHAKLFDEERKDETDGRLRQRIHRSNHLRLFYGSIIWKYNKYEIDDRKTALTIIGKDCTDWPQMQFQLACAYAIYHLLNERNFDRIRLKAFAKKLSGHCLYDFWFELLENAHAWEKMFNSDNLAPKQTLSLAFQFAIVHGYYELVTFIWNNITDPQREFIGLLQWRKVCFKARDREVLHFLCERLCTINAKSLARITWNTFYQTLQNSLQEDNRFREDGMHKLAFLLENTCPRLRSSMLSMENYRAVTDAFRYNQTELFALFLDYLEPEQLQLTRECIDRIYDRKKSEASRKQFRILLRRQQTFV
uniref:Rab-GAP TBC domain-containing protein n=1 Tax=Elaeophora elaphi TaxID=1147741 RepID=A0A0R3S7A3_9BILA